MVNVVYDSPDGAKNYTIGILADSLENYPKGMTTTVYVRSVRHELERDGLPTGTIRAYGLACLMVSA